MRVTRIVGSLAVALVAVGCMHHYRSYGRVGTRQLRGLYQLASQQMGCAPGALDARPVADRVWEVRGCGRAQEFAIVQSGYSGGRQWQPIAPVGARASNEMQCPPQSLAIHAPTTNVREVSGCGRQIRYQLACGDQQCEWVPTGYSGQWASGGGGVTVTPPGQAPPQQGYPQTPGGGVVVVPDTRGLQGQVERELRHALEAQRAQILACEPGAPAVQVHAFWNADGLVHLTLPPPFAGTQSERCVQQSVGPMQVTTGQGGAIDVVVR